MAAEIKVLVVDDEPDILEFLQYNLEKKGYEVVTAQSAAEGIQVADREVPDLILLDIMMPKMDGVQACYEMRRNPKLEKTLIAFLTARNEEYSEIAGLEAGADDYIQKPIRPRLLLSRISALLRRKHVGAEETSDIIDLGDLRIDQKRYEVQLKGEALSLARKEFEILVLLASQPGKVYSREEIFRKVWGYSESIASRTIDVHISKLREKLGGDYIRTLKGVGYKLDF